MEFVINNLATSFSLLTTNIVPIAIITIVLLQPLFLWPFLYVLDLIFNFATHSKIGAACEALKMGIMSAVVSINGIFRWAVTSSGAYLPRTPPLCENNPEMNTTLRCRNVHSILNVYCHCLWPCNQNAQKEAGVGPYLKKISILLDFTLKVGESQDLPRLSPILLEYLPTQDWDRDCKSSPILKKSRPSGFFLIPIAVPTRPDFV